MPLAVLVHARPILSAETRLKSVGPLLRVNEVHIGHLARGDGHPIGTVASNANVQHAVNLLAGYFGPERSVLEHANARALSSL